MLKVFIDESGTHNRSAIVVAGGYVASLEDWNEFEREWNELLSRNGARCFHRVDLERLGGEFARRRGWSDERRNEVLYAANQIIRRRTEAGRGGALVRAAFEEIMPPLVRRFYGSAYGWLVQECAIGFGHWAKDHDLVAPTEYVLEAGARGRRNVEEMLAALSVDHRVQGLIQIGDWRFAGKTEAPLQAADFFAYEVYRVFGDRLANKGRSQPVRPSAMSLLRPVVDQVNFWDAAKFSRWLKVAAPLLPILEERERRLAARKPRHR